MGICHHCQAALSWALPSPQPTDPNPTAPGSAGERLPAARLAPMGSGVRTAPHRGDTGYSAEKAASALPPAQLSNCHQQRPPRLAFSIYFPESQLPCSLSRVDLFSATLPSIPSKQAPCMKASFPIPPSPDTSSLDLQIPKVPVPGETSHCLCPWPQLTR